MGRRLLQMKKIWMSTLGKVITVVLVVVVIAAALIPHSTTTLHGIYNDLKLFTHGQGPGIGQGALDPSIQVMYAYLNRTTMFPFLILACGTEVLPESVRCFVDEGGVTVAFEDLRYAVLEESGVIFHWCEYTVGLEGVIRGTYSFTIEAATEEGEYSKRIFVLFVV